MCRSRSSAFVDDRNFMRVAGKSASRRASSVREERGVDGRGPHARLQVGEARPPHLPVARERRIGEHGGDLDIEAVLFEEAPVVMDGDRQRVAHPHVGHGGGQVPQLAVVGRLAPHHGHVVVAHVVDVEDGRHRIVGRRDARRPRSVRLPPRLGVGRRDLVRRPVERAHAQPDPAAVQRRQHRARVAQPHVGRPALLRQHVHVRQRRLELRGDHAGHRADVVGHAIEDHDLARADVRTRLQRRGVQAGAAARRSRPGSGAESASPRRCRRSTRAARRRAAPSRAPPAPRTSGESAGARRSTPPPPGGETPRR